LNQERLPSLLNRFPEAHILVVGDYFLDYYLDLDRTLSEISLETDLEAYQVVRVRSSPGAAGTVTSNLRALDVRVSALGVIGSDGMGYELLRGLRVRGVDTSPLIQVADRFTPTYSKPMMHEPDGTVHELNRLDIKNRQPMPGALEDQIIASLHRQIDQVDGIIVADQVQEANCGVITDRVRAALNELGRTHPRVTIAVDSRARIGDYRNVIVKPNAREAVLAIHPEAIASEIPQVLAYSSAQILYQRTGKPVFLTAGENGVLVFDEAGMTHIPGIHVVGPIDIVGAGDSTMAGIVAALCCGATNAEAARMGCLVASITIQQIGTTGTATREQIMQRHQSTSSQEE